jgi:phage I-like protein
VTLRDRQLDLFSVDDDRPAFLALCQIELTADGKLPEWIPLVPAGDADGLVKALDGRKFYNKDPQAVVDAFNKSPLDLPVDLEHSTEIKAPNGEPAPAYVWVDTMEVRGSGEIWGHVKEWTPKGGELVRNKEYRYISPAFLFEKATKIITDIVSAALTNRPALDMPAIARQKALAAQWTTAYINDLADSAFLHIESGGKKDSEGKTVPRSLRHFPYKDASGKIDLPHLRNAIARIPQAKIEGLDADALQKKAQRLLKQAQPSRANASMEATMDREKLIAKLGLTAEATDEQIMAELDKLKAGPEAELQTVKTELETTRAKLKSTEQELANARSANPSLDKFVPRSDHDAVVAKCKALEKEKGDVEKAAFQKEVDVEIDAAMKAGKVTPATKDFYVAACSTKEGLDKFKEFVKAATSIGNPSRLETDPPPVPTSDARMSAEEEKIAASFGMTREDYLKGRASMKQEMTGAVQAG